MSKHIETVEHEGVLLSLIIRKDYAKEGIEFFTPGEFSQQLGYMKHPKGKQIQPHIHNPVKREVHFTQEVLLIKSGTVRVDFYSNNQAYIGSKTLYTGDVILLAEGGHGFEMLEEAEMIEIKQGPFAGEQDKTRFDTKLGDKIKEIA